MGHGCFLHLRAKHNYNAKCNSRSLGDDKKVVTGRRLVPGELSGGPAAAEGFDQED